jgi:glycosyltransferase involved in cell wall biosynthesis
VITFYNTPLGFFREAIESVLGQTYRNWELLLVDDGSSDQSTHLARQFAESHPMKVHYLAHPGRQNCGMSASRQLGISEASGEYVAFLDSDDVWVPDKLAEQVAILEGYPEAGMVYGNTLYWSSWSANQSDDNVRRDFIPRLGVAPNRVVEPPALLPLFLRGDAAVPCTCSVLVRKRTLEQAGGFEARFRNLYEDQVFYAKICLDLPVFVSDRCWDKYRQYPGSACATADAARERAARIEFLQWLESYLSTRGQVGGVVWRAVRNELWSARLHPTVRRALKPFRRTLRKVVTSQNR